MNVQVVADPASKLLWISPALQGCTHDVTAARTHRVVRICGRHGVPVLADRAYTGTGPWVTAPGQTPTPRRTHSHEEGGQPGSVSSTGTSSTKCHRAEVLADLPRSPMQREPPDVINAAAVLTTERQR